MGTKSPGALSNKTVDKCEGGDPSDEDVSWSMVRSLKTMSPSRTHRCVIAKKARGVPGLDVETMKGEIVRWLTGLTSNMVEG
ncbi:hypothetical protein Bca52824_053255 [Brassica carinata]|uniref:Uncharacterized protein n=1 Tax=Brassica carinata TaxID=52824 RepID=A0A8X7R4W6_BRACI|nr:hypothetical protein Bca52824_053255 [Brassica carinata]